MGSSPDSTPTPSLRESSSFETLVPRTSPTPEQEEQAGLLDIVALDDLAEAAWQLYDLCTLPDAQPRRAQRLATGLLRPCPSPPTSALDSPTAPATSTGRSAPAIDRLGQLKGAVAILIGLHALLISHEADPTCLEGLLQALVGVCIKGVIRSPRVAGPDQRLHNELVERLVGDVLYDQDCPWSVWQLADHLVDQTERALDRSPADGGYDRQTGRVLINIVYLRALLASASESQALADTRSSFQLTEVIKLGCAMSILGASPYPLDSCSPQEAHISTLVWKSRKRLELFGHVDVALSGLPDGGSGFDRWAGGAQERTRQAEERRRKQDAEKATRRRPVAHRSRTTPARPAGDNDDLVDVEEPVGQLLAPPLRLKGKKIRHCRAGSYHGRQPADGILGLSTSTAPAKDSAVALCTPSAALSTGVLPGAPATDYFQYSTSMIPSRRSVSATSLPSLERRASTCLLRTPPTSPTTAAGPDLDPHLASLKATVPRPLPTLLSTRPIFSLAHGDFAAVDDGAPDPTPQRTSWVRAIPAQARFFSVRLQPLASLTKKTSPWPLVALLPPRSDAPHDDQRQQAPEPSSSSQVVSPPPSLSMSLSSRSSLPSPLQSPRPIPVAQVPSIGFTPSSHHPSAGEDSIFPCGGRTLKSYTPLSSRLDCKLRREL